MTNPRKAGCKHANMRTMAEGLGGSPPCSHIHMFTTLAPHGLRARFVSGPRRCGPFPESKCRDASAVAVAWLDVWKVEYLQPKVLVVPVSVRLLDEPSDLIVEAFRPGV